MTKVDQPAEEEGPNDDRGQEAQGVQVFLRKDVIEHMLNQKRQRPISSAEQEHAHDGRNEVREQVRA